MTYIENIFLCLALPPILSLFFTSGGARRFMLFFTIGMSACLLSAYVSSFFMGYYGCLLYTSNAASAGRFNRRVDRRTGFCEEI